MNRLLHDVGGVVVAITLLFSGCSRSDGLVPVSGRLTFGGKPPPAAASLTFVPQEVQASGKDDGLSPRIGLAVADADGRFAAGTFRDGDGLRPGTYEVRVLCSRAPAVVGEADRSDSLVPPGFVAPPLVISPDDRSPVDYQIDVR
jgi:hypothetical protein